ncbi:endonuclease/exonuclease/phosphatase family protein [Magnetospira sp. QH-2]|uniref:endonuclease/exonuclease/phosphatase family protein n=1 Tax=Magnetospira sp. (strain QH-2) TaxID=1288970 RepID=UPI00130E69EA|nr:endonuclease/exonuclease/phosphatase family protein [Magnetospira sp. QH-2]
MILLSIANGFVIVNGINGPPVTSSAPSDKLLSFNLNLTARHGEATADWIRETQADWVLLQEVTPSHLPFLESLKDSYPHQAIRPHPSYWGLAILSKHPLINEVVTQNQTANFFTLSVQSVGNNGGGLTILNTHLEPPVSHEKFQRREIQLAALKMALDRIKGPLVIGGDFNATPWSPLYRDLLSQNRLLASGSVLWSWPSGWLLPGIPIDHFFGRDGAQVRVLSAGPDLGSDHKPLLADVAF